MSTGFVLYVLMHLFPPTGAEAMGHAGRVEMRPVIFAETEAGRRADAIRIHRRNDEVTIMLPPGRELLEHRDPVVLF